MKIKILHFIHRLEYSDGIKNYVQTLCSRYDKNLYEITILTFNEQNNREIIDEFKRNGIYVYNLKTIFYNKFQNRYLKLFLRNLGLDYIYKFVQLKETVFELKPKIMIVHGEDCELIGGFLRTSFVKINVLHGFIFFPKNFVFRYILTKYSRKRFNYTILVNNSLQGLVAYKSQTYIIPAGIELEKFRLKTTDRVKSDPYIILGYIGRLSREKNIDRIIKAFSLLVSDYENIILLIAGKGNYYHSLKKMVRPELRDRIKFLGEVKDSSSFYNRIDIFINVSDFEGGPITLMEALASGKVVISTNVGLVPELIDLGIKIVRLNNSTVIQIKDTLETTINDLDFYIEDAKKNVPLLSEFSSNNFRKHFYKTIDKIIAN